MSRISVYTSRDRRLSTISLPSTLLPARLVNYVRARTGSLRGPSFPLPLPPPSPMLPRIKQAKDRATGLWWVPALTLALIMILNAIEPPISYPVGLLASSLLPSNKRCCPTHIVTRDSHLSRMFAE